MNIIKKPDSLSFVGNLNDFVLSGIDSSVSFSLSSSEGEIINETYSPDSEGKIVISIKDIVKDFLSIEIPPLSSQAFIQKKAVKRFSAKLNTSTHSFTVIKGGVANLSESTSQFLKLNFLTWQAQTKEILQRNIEFLSYYTQETCSLKIKAYFTDNSTSVKTISLTANKHYSFNLSYDLVSSYFSKKVCYYDVYVEGSNRLTYVQRYMLTNVGDFAQIYLFENSLGAIDTLLCTGSLEKKPRSESSLAVCFDETVVVDTSLFVEYSQNTGYIDSKSQADWISELFYSPQIVHYTDVLKKIYIRENDNTFIEDTLNNFSFNFYGCLNELYQKQNRDRDTIPPYLNYSNDLFFLKTRLAELNTLSLSSEIFIPGQLLGSDSWGKVSINSLITEIFAQMEMPSSSLNEIELKHYLTKENYATQQWVVEQKYGSSDSNVDISKLWKKEEVANLDKLRIDADGNLYVPGNVCAFADSDYLSKIIDSLPIASTSSKGIAQFSDSQFTVINGVVSINANFVGGGLDEASLSSWLKSNSYATESWVTDKRYLTTHQSLANLALKNHSHSQYLTAHQSLVGYATESWVKTATWGKKEVANLDKLRIDAQGNLYVSGNVCAFADSDYLSSVLSSLPVASTSSKGIAQFSDSQFSVVNGVVSINANFVGGGLDESALASWLSSHSYATETWVTSRGYLTSHQSLSHLASYGNTATGVSSNYAEYTYTNGIKYKLRSGYADDSGKLGGFASSHFQVAGNYLTSHQSLNGYATENWVNDYGTPKKLYRHGGYDANLIIGGGCIGNYGSSSYWVNVPAGMNYGSIHQFNGYSSESLSLQLACDVNHNTANSTRYLWFRTSNNLGFQNDWKKIYHTGYKPSYSDVGASAAIHHHSEYVNKTALGNISIESNSGTWWQKISTEDDSSKNTHRFIFSERQGTGGYKELFGVDGYGNIYANNYKVATEIWLKSQLSNYLTKIKASHFVVGYDWGAKTNGFHCGVDGINGGLSFYDGKKDHSASIFRDADTNLYVGARSGIKDKGITIDINGNVVGSGNVTAFSDMRLKSFKAPLKSVLSNIDKLSTFYYYWKDKAKYDSNLHLGLSAQAVDSLFPEFVNHADILSLDYGKLGAVLAVRGLQEVKSWMSTSDKRILELEKQVSKLKKQLKYVA
jgi:hypothetical protein